MGTEQPVEKPCVEPGGNRKSAQQPKQEIQRKHPGIHQGKIHREKGNGCHGN